MVPRTISHYRVLQLLGEGGMGEVHLAEDTNLNRKVAIKFLSTKSLSDSVARKRFIREAQAAASLDHPNICPIYEVGETDDACFIVMQYLEGETLDQKISSGRLEVAEAVRSATQMADALAEAHTHGIVHRDIKPQNLFLTSRGQLKVLDFGLAKLIATTPDSDSSANTLALLSNPGTLIGTMPYMSPEQVRGEDVDYRSDIFSLGTVLYEMLTANQPFADRSPAVTLSAILTKDPPLLSHYIQNPPVELERIVRKCLEKSREERYQSARDLAIDLRHLRRVTADTSPLVRTEIESKRHWPFKWIAATAISTVLVAGSVYLLARRNGKGGDRKPISSVAVLPFSDGSENADTRYLSDGMTDGLINSISKIPNVRTIGRSSVFRYQGRTVDAHTVGRDLGVDSVLTGRIIERGDTLTIIVELADAKDDHHIWGAQYSRLKTQVIALQDDLTQTITDGLDLGISGDEAKRLTHHGTENDEAYRLYLKGRYFWNKRTEADIKKAIEYYQQATDIDPNYALAYAGTADAYVSLASGGFEALLPNEAMPKAKAAAAKALELDPTLAEAHASLGYVKFLYDWDWSAADNEFSRALELNPNYPTTHLFRSLLLITRARQDEAIAESRRAVALDPLSLSLNTNVGRALLFAHKYDEAVDELRKTVEMDPKYVPSHYLLGFAYHQKQMYREALDEFNKVTELSGGSAFSQAAEAMCYASSGRRPEALRIAGQLTASANTKQGSPYYVAVVYACLGDSAQAVKWLEKCYERRSYEVVYLKVEPAFDKVRQDPQFQSLITRAGL